MIRYFNRKTDIPRNPFMGFTSFQHVNGEPLYSDIVVRPENKMTETENVECYPVPEDVPQNGREEGFYPEASIAYYRVLWKEFEPEQGKYRPEFVQEILDKAKKAGETVHFRLMAHSTRARDDVPEWLKSLVVCPERPDGKREKASPEDPLFLELFEEAVQKLGEYFDENPVFHGIDISLPGSWGEGYQLEKYKDEDLKRLVDIFIDAFPHTELQTQIGLPWLITYVNEKRTIGVRGDGCGSPAHMNQIYPERFAAIDPDLWKKAPVSFEAYWWLSEWKRQGWDADEIIRKTLEWHVSCFNGKSLPIPHEWKEKVGCWLLKMGYHLVICSFETADEISGGSVLPVRFVVKNEGVAPLYEETTVSIRLRNEKKTYEILTSLKPVFWLPGETEEKLELLLPAKIEKGDYFVEIGMTAKNSVPVYFESDAKRTGHFYEVGKVCVC